MKSFRLLLLGCILALPVGSHGAPVSSHFLKQATSKIDAILDADRQAAGVSRNQPISDEVFVRRIFLDLAGRIPTPSETLAFLNFQNPDKRSILIQTLMNRDSYASNFYNYWADILRYKGDDPHSPRGLRVAYRMFIEDALASNKPYDRFVRELLSAKGYPWENGAVGYYERDTGMPLDNMAITTRIFLGTQIECAQCHDHPFDRWKQSDFYKLSAYTHGSTVKDPLPMEVWDVFGRASGKRHAWYPYASQSPRTSMKLPPDFRGDDAKPGDIVVPTPLFGAAAPRKPNQDYVEVFANWVTSPKNPRFTKVIVNRLWKKLFGIGVIRDFDTLTEASAPMIPALEIYLEHLMVELEYDMKAFLTVLANTHTYQSAVSSTDPDPEAVYHFPGPLLRRMTAEQIWDSLVALVSHEPEAKLWRSQASRNLQMIRQVTDVVSALGFKTLHEVAHGEGKLGEARSRRDKTSKDYLVEKEAVRRGRGSQDNLVKLEEELASARKEYEEATQLVAMRSVERFAEKRGWKKEDIFVDENMKPYAPGNTLGGQWLQRLYFPGYGALPKSPQQLEKDAAAKKKMLLDYATRIGIDPEDHPMFLRYCQDLEGTHRRRSESVDCWYRASELTHNPAQRGHFLRIMGASDRNLADNSRQDAGIPQVMMLMNSELVSKAGIMAPFSPLMVSINKEKTVAGKMDAAYLALLSRKATVREHEIWENRASNVQLNEIEDLIYALINTQQFIFIQ
jgi:hypothetical protein